MSGEVTKRPDGDAVPLKPRTGALLRFAVVAIAFAAYIALLFAADPPWINAVVTGLFVTVFVFLYLRRFSRRYLVRGRVLVISRLFGSTEIDLSTVEVIDLRAGYYQTPSQRSSTQLLLILDDVKVLIGDSLSGLCYEAPGLLALAQGLQQSDLSRTCEVGASLERLARRPDAPGSWPTPEQFPRWPDEWSAY